jgi:hypothetical protein
MDYQTAKSLLDKYFAGETGLEEEGRLRDYFTGSDVDDRLQAYIPLFGFWQKEAGQNLPGSFDDRLAAITRPVPKAGILTWALRVAAVLLIAFAVWQVYPKAGAPEQTAAIDWSRYEVEDPREALRITKAALQKTGNAVNDGARQAAEEMQKLKRLARPMAE